MTERAAILGRVLFEVFPDNPDDPSADGAQKLRASLDRVVATRRLDQMSTTRYPIPRPAALGGGFDERWWTPRNARVVGAGGEVACIIHHVEDVTDRVRAEVARRESQERLRRAVEERGELLKELRHRVKNNLQVITSLLEMQARQTADHQVLIAVGRSEPDYGHRGHP